MTDRAHRWTASISMIMALLGFAGLQLAHAQSLSQPKDFNVPAQSATTGIPEFARQAGIQILVSEPLVRGKRISAVAGSHSIDEALTILLKGTGLTATSKDGATYTVAAAQAVPPATRNPATTSKAGAQDPLLSRSSPDGPGSADGERLEEIIVTAQKRQERLQDVPVPVTVISSQTLLDTNQLRLQDYYTSVPGLNFSIGNRGETFVSIRGISTTGYSNPTVGVVIDDVPYGSSTSLGGGGSVPDLDPSDLAQVEVLRGPQGTLYGASSMGGLLKFTTVDPSTDGVSGSVQAGANFVHNGNEAGYSARGSINLPLSDALAMRASAFVRRDPGYVNDLVQHIDGINWGDAYGGRLSALWRPLDNVSLKLSALFQDTKTHGSSDADPTLGDLQQQELPGSGGYEKKFQVYNATLTAKFGSFDLTSLTGYTVNRVKDSFDYTPVFGFADQFLYPAAGVSGSLFLNNNRTTKVSEEVRISTKLGDHVDWLVGGFYTHEDSQWSQDILAANQNSGAVVGPIYYSPFPTTFSEYAGFTDLTFHITHQFDVQIGARESFNTQTYRETIYGPYTVFLGYNGLPIINPEIESKANSFTYLFTPQLKLSDDMMAYARLASGYRPAGINALSNILGTPPSDKPDKTYNYEIGVKGAVLEHRLSFDASVYYIDWKDIQLELALKGTGYGGNASRAKSEGIELSTEVRPFTGLTVSTWMAYNNAVLTAPIPPNPSAVGDSGDRLPFSSRFSGNVSLEQNFPLGDALTGFIGGTESYASNRIGVFTSTSARQTYPAYAKTDFRAGLRYEAWELHLFANNVTDRRGELTGGLGTLHTADFTFIQPRTVGFLASKRF